MPSFDPEKAYAPQEDVFFDDGREEAVLEFVFNNASRGSVPDILKTIDEYARTKRFLMNVGEDKGRIVTEIIRERKPSNMVELGGYCGYSTILFANAMKEVGGNKYFCLERSPKFARNIAALVKFAGLDDIVEVVMGPSDQGIKKLHASGNLTSIDMIFLDHYKPAYTTDLKLCESLGLIVEGTVLAADNVIKPGNPPYLKYVRSTTEEKIMAFTKAAGKDTDHFHNRTSAQYGKVEKLSSEAKGNPNIVYKSDLINSFEPSGIPDAIEITRCLGIKQE